MKEIVYFGHKKTGEFKREFYLPIKNTEMNEKFEVFFPHDTEEFFNTKEIIKSSKLIIAEVSEPAIGLGIELGWANAYGVKIICIYKKGSYISKSLSVICDAFFEYEDEISFKNIINQIASNIIL